MFILSCGTYLFAKLNWVINDKLDGAIFHNKNVFIVQIVISDPHPRNTITLLPTRSKKFLITLMIVLSNWSQSECVSKRSIQTQRYIVRYDFFLMIYHKFFFNIKKQERKRPNTGISSLYIQGAYTESNRRTWNLFWVDWMLKTLHPKNEQWGSFVM